MDKGKGRFTGRKNQRVLDESTGVSAGTVRVVNVFIVCVVIVLAFEVAEGSFTSRINKISDHLNKALDEVLFLGNVNYTDLNINETYYSKTHYKAKGMSDLYLITQKFMQWIVRKDIYPEGFITLKDGNLVVASPIEQWQTLLLYYAGVLVIVVLLLLFAVFMPICGFFFCCCRCCGKCGARSQPFDKKGDFCKKFIYSFFLIGLGTLLIFGVVCAFASNQYMHDGTNELTINLRTSVKDTDTFIKATNAQVKTLLIVNYREFKTVLFDTLDRCSDIVLEQLGEYSNATALTEVVNIVKGLDRIKSNLIFMKTVTKELQVNASQLNDGLRSVKRSLLQTLMNCTHRISGCNELSNNVSRLSTEIDFNSLPDISNEIDQLNRVIDANITSTVLKGQQAFENIRIEINNTISSQLPEVKAAVEEAGRAISKGATNISSILNNISLQLYRNTDEPLNQLNKYIKEYAPYRYYIGLGASGILLTVTVFISLGLFCGICCGRPETYRDDCCHKGTGSRFLMMAVGVMFLSSIVLALITIIYFLTGVTTQRLVCDSLRHPKDNKVVSLVDDFIHYQFESVDANIADVVESCHKNETVYKVLNLKSVFNIEDVGNYLDKFNINKTLSELTSKINANTKIVILDETAQEQLLQLVESGIANIGYDKFIDELRMSQNLTSISLTFLIEKLEELIKIVEEKLDNSQSIVASLRLNAFHLYTYQTMLVEPMTAKSKEMIDVAENLKESLKFGKDSFEIAISDLINELVEAQDYLQNNGSATLHEIAVNFITSIEKQVKSYLNRVVNNTLTKVGQCYPASLIYNATLTATCDKILYPWNGHWFSILWSLFLFIPIIIFSVKLSTLYQKYKPYPGSLVESEFLHDLFEDRDNIPLNSPHGKKGKKKQKKKSKRLDGRGTYVTEGSERATPVAGGSSYPDARYADMAPKHWEDFPNGGPPQYQRAPTEYERPPPYYFPGTPQQK